MTLPPPIAALSTLFPMKQLTENTANYDVNNTPFNDNTKNRSRAPEKAMIALINAITLLVLDSIHFAITGKGSAVEWSPGYRILLRAGGRLLVKIQKLLLIYAFNRCGQYQQQQPTNEPTNQSPQHNPPNPTLPICSQDGFLRLQVLAGRLCLYLRLVITRPPFPLICFEK
jgi:hypothetical protein